MERSNDYMIIPVHGHLRVFCEGKDIADVDTYQEAYQEIREYFENKEK